MAPTETERAAGERSPADPAGHLLAVRLVAATLLRSYRDILACMVSSDRTSATYLLVDTALLECFSAGEPAEGRGVGKKLDMGRGAAERSHPCSCLMAKDEIDHPYCTTDAGDIKEGPYRLVKGRGGMGVVFFAAELYLFRL